MISHAQLHQQRQGSSHRRDLIHALRRRLAFLDLVLPPSGTARCRAHGVLRDDTTGAGKGIVADMDGAPARIWRQVHLARVGDALRTRRRSDAERIARAEEWHSEVFLRSTRRDPGLVTGHFSQTPGSIKLPQLTLLDHHQKLASAPTLIHQ